MTPDPVFPFDHDDSELEVETDEVLAEQFGIIDGDFVMVADNGATDIEVKVLEKNMENVVRSYLAMHPEWAKPSAMLAASEKGAGDETEIPS